MIKFPSPDFAGNGSARYQEREAYLAQAATDFKGGNLPKEMKGYWICFACRHAIPPSTPKALPWLTLVLGSGCVTETTDQEARDRPRPSDFANRLKGADLEDLRRLPDFSDGAALVAQFLQQLAVDRLGPGNAEESTESGDRDVSALDALLLLCSALATCFWHEVSALGAAPFRSRGSDQLEFSTAISAQRFKEVRAIFGGHLIKVLKRILGDQVTGPPLSDLLRATLRKLLLALDQSDPAEIRKVDLQILTELVWLRLGSNPSDYHGWSDLLALLADKLTSDGAPSDYPLRPHSERMFVLEAIRKHYLDCTVASWDRRKLGLPGERVKFFDSTARLTVAQSKALRKAGPNRFPVASVFTTSFDMELEMALLANPDFVQSETGIKGMVIVLPVLVYARESDSVESFNPSYEKFSHFRWMAAFVCAPSSRADVGSGDLRRLLKPMAWRVLTGWNWNSLPVDDEDPQLLHLGDYRSWPVIVHLAGCPWLDLPEWSFTPSADTVRFNPRLKRLNSNWLCQVEPLADDSADDKALPLKPSRLEHALLLDEYASIQQFMTELYSIETRGDVDFMVPFQLPLSFTGGHDRTKSAGRFWLVMGVQVDDAAVRFGMASRLIASRHVKSQQDSSSLPERSGLLVTRKISDAARELLRWFAVDTVVGKTCTTFTGDIDHMARHFEGANGNCIPQPMPAGGKPCSV